VAPTKEKIMTTRTAQQTALCTLCGGECRNTTITHEEQRGDGLYIFHNVPANVCGACGEVWINDEVLEQIDHLIAKGTPTHTVQTPVYDFSAVAPTR
jgi:YgiT-type zinc finger domain-containing protein